MSRTATLCYLKWSVKKIYETCKQMGEYDLHTRKKEAYGVCLRGSLDFFAYKTKILN